MITLLGDNTVWFDVDDTLVMWHATSEQLAAHGVEIVCPGSYFLNDVGQIEQGPSFTNKILPHGYHIDQLKRHKLRGHRVIVWSAGGAAWAEAAMKGLRLEEFVDLCIAKPTWLYDDKKIEEFIPKPYWFKWEKPE
jgi:hypothetical protein